MRFMKNTLENVALDVSVASIACYADVTGDYNPIHVDPVFAASTEMKGVIAHGTMSLNLIWQALEKTLGKDALSSVELDVRFRRPVRPGDRIEAGGELENDQVYKVWATNQNGERLIEGTAAITG
jgi:3-hydroxybutyryl-CoA dehydratase